MLYLSYRKAFIIAHFDKDELWLEYDKIPDSRLSRSIEFALTKYWHEWNEARSLPRELRITLEEWFYTGIERTTFHLQKTQPQWDVDLNELHEIVKRLDIAVKGYNKWLENRAENWKATQP